MHVWGGLRRPSALIGLLGALAGVTAGCAGVAGGGGGARVLRVSGSTTVSPVAVEAAEALRSQGMEVTVDSQGGSAGGMAQLGRGQVDVAMSSKPLAQSDRDAFPGVDFVATEIGRDAVGIVVRRQVYDAGLRSLARPQVAAIFEGRVANWRELGGPDLRLFVYDKEPGRGTREQLDRYLYGPGAVPPPPPAADNFAVVGGNEETRAKLLSTPGSVGPLSTSFVAGHPDLAAVALDGVEATPGEIRSGRYPMSRPLYLVTDGPPSGTARRFVDLVLSAQGQQIVRRHGFLTLSDLGLG